MFYAILLIAIGVASIIYPSYAAFERTNENGVEVFNNFGDSLGAAMFEPLMRLVGLIFIVYGIVLIYGN